MKDFKDYIKQTTENDQLNEAVQYNIRNSSKSILRGIQVEVNDLFKQIDFDMDDFDINLWKSIKARVKIFDKSIKRS